MTPTAHLRLILKGRHIPTKEEVYACAAKSGSSVCAALRYLQQWWSEGESFSITDNPDGCVGEWRDVPPEVT